MAKGAEDTCTVLVRVKERGRFHLRTGTYVTGTEGGSLPVKLMVFTLLACTTMVCKAAAASWCSES